MTDLPTREQWCTAHNEYECTDHCEADELPMHCWGVGAHDEDTGYASCKMVTLMTRQEVYDSLDLGKASDVMHEVVGLGRGVVVTSSGIAAVIAAAFGKDTT